MLLLQKLLGLKKIYMISESIKWKKALKIVLMPAPLTSG